MGNQDPILRQIHERQQPTSVNSGRTTHRLKDSKCEKIVLCPKKIHPLKQVLREELLNQDPGYKICWRCDYCNLYVEGPNFHINPWHCECGYDLCDVCYELKSEEITSMTSSTMGGKGAARSHNVHPARKQAQ